ncbi:MAG TPA: hypothetical protein VFP47_08805 [Pyrinomonadaceae bacterium]|nr:hypothetical protein [Pyrinomonadaceae bacterium]
MISRRGFLAAIVGSAAVSALQGQSIDREALVRRHNPVLRQLDPRFSAAAGARLS